MKNSGTLLILLIAGITLAFTGLKQKSDLAKRNLKGKVKSTVENHYDVMNVSGVLEKFPGHVTTTTATYNLKGNLIEEHWPWVDTYYTYDKHDILTGRITKYKIDSNTQGPIEVRDSVYTGGYTEIEKGYNLDKSLASLTITMYDDKGEATETTIKSFSKNGDSVIHRTFSTVYDSAGNIQKDEVFEANGSLRCKHKYEYNKRGDLTAIIGTSKDSEGEIDDTTAYEYTQYDAMGNWIKRTQTDTYIGMGVVGHNIIEREIIYY